MPATVNCSIRTVIHLLGKGIIIAVHSNTESLQNVRKAVYTGSVHGVIAWIVYAVVEHAFTPIIPWIIKSSHSYMTVHQGFTVLLFIIYPLIGLILGGLSGLIFHAATDQNRFLKKEQFAVFFPLAAILTVIVVFELNLTYVTLFSHFSAVNLLPSLGVSLLLLAVLAFSAKNSLRYGQLRFLTNPWTVTIALFGILPWVPYEPLSNQTMTVKAVAALLYPGAVFLISFFVYKLVRTRRIDKSTEAMPISPARTLAFTISIFLVVFGIGLLLKQTPLLTEQNSVSSFKGSNRPNVILITMDTVRADHLSLYGYARDTTPNLKILSEQATLYSNAIATSETTLDSHASIFTGLYSRSHGAHYTLKTPAPSYDELGESDLWTDSTPLAEKFNTLAEFLSAKGYLTMAVVANHAFLADSYRTGQGFQHYDYRSPVPLLGHYFGKTRLFYLRQSIHNILSNFTSSSDYYMASRTADEINRKVFALLDKVDSKNERFFLFINYLDAHRPYMPPTPYDKLFPGKDETFRPWKFAALKKQVMSLERKITDKERRHIVSQYDGGIAYMDFHIGALIARLKESGLYENSLFIVTSDHGEAFGEKNFMTHGSSVYQNQVYVPLVIRYPGGSRKGVIDTVTSGVDIMPTVLDTLGYEIPEYLQGISLMKVEQEGDRSVISESFSNRKHIETHRRFYRIERAVFSGTMKFISSTSGKRELYDLSIDPEEKRNIYRKDAAVAVDLEARLNQWLATVADESLSGEGVASHRKLDKETLDRLKALGYIQ